RDDVVLNALPLAFTYGLGQVLTVFRASATLVLERSFLYPESILETIRRERVTGLPLVPSAAALLLRQRLADAAASLRYITNAAAPLPVSRIRQLRALLPDVKLFSMYGQTECQRALYLPPLEIDACPDSVGIAIPGA